MIRNLKALGIAFVAVFAMSAIAASGAQATNAHLKCTTEEPSCVVELTEHPNPVLGVQVFETVLGVVECSEFDAVYEGASTATGNSTLEEVEYNNCEAFGIEAEVDFGTCDYTLAAPFETVAGHGQGDVTIGPAGCVVTIIVGSTAEPLCEIFVEGAQPFEDAITYTNVETNGKEEITGHANANGIEYSWEGLICGEGEDNTGTYEGTFTAKAFKTPSAGGAQVNLTTVDT